MNEIKKKSLESETLEELKAECTYPKKKTNNGKKSQLSLISGAIKRKATDDDDSNSSLPKKTSEFIAIKD